MVHERNAQEGSNQTDQVITADIEINDVSS